MRAFLSILFGFWVFCGHSQSNADSTFKPVELPEGFTARLNVVYTTVGAWEGKADLYLPPQSNGPSPVLINIHGGGWNHGTKEGQGGFGSFFKSGFAVFNMEYRLTGQAPAPAAVEDARCALIYLIRNARELNIDPKKIVIMGGSAGGHLALMAGLLGKDHLFDTNCPGVDDIKVLAIIDKYGITDVWDWAYGKNITSKSAINWLGNRARDEEFARSVSPVNYITPNSPPVFIVHGDADPTVPYQHSADLYKKLQEAGVKTGFFTVPGGLHGKFDKETNGKINAAILKFISELN